VSATPPRPPAEGPLPVPGLPLAARQVRRRRPGIVSRTCPTRGPWSSCC